MKGESVPTKKATPADAQVLMQLYDLRRESEMRKARNWWLTEFWPDSADDFMKVAMDMGSQENAWLRQVGGYWGMAASFALSGAVNQELFLQPAICGEMFFLFAKLHPFLGEVREKLGDPQAFANIEKLIKSTKFGRDRLQFTLKRIAMAKERRAARKS
jgi:hypothetical protein